MAAAAAAAATAGRTSRERAAARLDWACLALRDALTRTAARCGAARQIRPLSVTSAGSDRGAIRHQVRGSPT
ncbi:hypothetical protein GCM10018952_03920 [Streptosporangium vulgare]